MEEVAPTLETRRNSRIIDRKEDDKCWKNFVTRKKELKERIKFLALSMSSMIDKKRKRKEKIEFNKIIQKVSSREIKFLAIKYTNSHCDTFLHIQFYIRNNFI